MIQSQSGTQRWIALTIWPGCVASRMNLGCEPILQIRQNLPNQRFKNSRRSITPLSGSLSQFFTDITQVEAAKGPVSERLLLTGSVAEERCADLFASSILTMLSSCFETSLCLPRLKGSHSRSRKLRTSSEKGADCSALAFYASMKSFSYRTPW